VVFRQRFASPTPNSSICTDGLDLPDERFDTNQISAITMSPLLDPATLAPTDAAPPQSQVGTTNVHLRVRERDAREIHATPNPARFLALAAQLAALLLVFRLYRLERSGFLMMSAVAFGVFLIHYWIPFRFKEASWVVASLAAAFLLLGTSVAALVIGVGSALFLILRCPIPYRWRLLFVAATFGVLIYACATKRFLIPTAFYPVFGAIFMFRIIIYMYDLAYSREPARLVPFLSYFFLLPNYFFTFFPVIDFQTMRRTYYQRDIHDIAQQGIHWMARGTVHLMLYRVVYYFDDPYLPDRVTSFPALIAKMVLTFLLYLNVSGQFHLAVGMLHLFGYDLPETNRRYLLASGFTDLWRRINIYWKDFMMKIVYFPVYFKLRRAGDVRAQIIAAVTVFVATWALHSYQFFWIRGHFPISWPDSIFWTILGVLVTVSMLLERRHKGKSKDYTWRARAILPLQRLATFSILITLWSLWSSPTLNSWVYLMTHWMQVSR
jgi:alginate O-acetyltransferase complex protein AlgI